MVQSWKYKRDECFVGPGASSGLLKFASSMHYGSFWAGGASHVPAHPGAHARVLAALPGAQLRHCTNLTQTCSQ